MSVALPDRPALVGCVCFGTDRAGACICTEDEMALRAWSSPNWHPPPMTAEQRHWCEQEIRACGDSTSQPASFGEYPDADLARAVLHAWQDFAQDKGLL